MVGVGLQAHERRTVVEDAVSIGLGDGLCDLLHVGIALADELVVADADHIGHEGDHGRGLADRLAVGDLGLGLVEVLELQAKHVRAGSEGEAGAGRVVTEVRDRQAGLEDAGRDVALAEVAQGIGHEVERLQLIGGLVPGVEEIALVHVREVEGLELVEELLELCVHVSGPFRRGRAGMRGEAT